MENISLQDRNLPSEMNKDFVEESNPLGWIMPSRNE